MDFNEKHMEERMRKAFPPIEPPQEFRHLLKEELLSMQRKTAQKKKPFIAVLAAVAAVLALTFALWPDSPTQPGLPLLPPITATGPETQGASSGPGFTVELQYQTGTFTAFPGEAAVYRHPSIPFGREALADIAERLDVRGAITEEGWQDGVTYQIGEPDTGMIIAFPNGYYHYSLPLPDNTADPRSPNLDAITARATEFLARLGIDPQNAYIRETQQPRPDDPYPLTAVTFAPSGIVHQISYAPFVRIQLGPDGTVYSAGWLWPAEAETMNAYPLRTAEEAWADIAGGQGILEINYADVPGPVDGNVVRGTGRIQENTIGYILTYAEDGTVILQPVAAFRGVAEVDDGTQVPFTVYTQAVKNQFYQ